MVITVCDLIEKFECAGKFTLCGNNVTRKYLLIADRPNKAKKMYVALFCPSFRFYGGAWPSYTPLPIPLVGYFGSEKQRGSKFSGFRGTFWFAGRGVNFPGRVWISKKEKPSSGIGKYQFSYLNSQFSKKFTSIFRE